MDVYADVLSDAFWFTVVLLVGIVGSGYTWWRKVYVREKRERKARQDADLAGRGKDRPRPEV